MVDFKTMAERLKSEIRSRAIGPNTDVVLVTHCVDGAGNLLPPLRNSIVPTTKVKFSGNRDGAKAFAAAVHLDGILKNIDSLVGSTPNELMTLADGPSSPVRVVNYELEVGD